MPFQAGAIVSQLTLNRAKFSAAMKQVSGEVKGFGGLVKKNSAQIKKMGRTMTVAGAAILGTIGAMVKAYASFDEAMVKSLAIMGNISPAMRKEMEKTARQLSTESTFAAKDLAEAYFFLASAGMNAEQSISALAPVSRFAQAGAFDLALATDLLTDAQTALGLSSKNVAENEKNLIRVSDVLVGANTLANASVLQFSESLTNKAAAALVNVNKEVEEGVAVLAAYADKGVKGRLAGQRLTMMLNGLFDAARNNKKAWDDIDISLFNADESMRAIGDIIADLEVHLGSMTVKQREAELAALGFNIKTKDSILTLMGSSEKIKIWTEKLKDMQGITKEVADKQLEAFNAKLTRLKNVVVGAAISIGGRLAPMIEQLIEKVKKVAARLTLWIEAHPKLTEWIVKLAAGVGVLLTFLGPLAMMLPGLVTGFVLLKAAVIGLSGPVGLAALALAGIALAIRDIIKTHKEAVEAMSNMALSSRILDKAALNFQKLWIRVRKEGGPALEQFNELMTRFGGNWDKILKQIIADPKLANLKTILIEVARKVGGITAEGENLSITLPGSFTKVGGAAKETVKVFTSWATTVGKAFHDTAVRVAQMKGSFKSTSFVVGGLVGDLETGFGKINIAAVKAAKLPPFAVEIPKMSLKDLRDFYIKWLAKLVASWKTAWQAALAGARDVVSALDSLFSQFHANEATRLDNEEKEKTDAIETWYEQERARIEATITDEEELVAALEALDEEKARRENELQHQVDKERRKLERAKAKSAKASALFTAGINVAEAITKAFTAGPIIGQILAGIVAVLGAVQMAAIAAAPLPSLQKGGIVEREGAYHLHAGEEVRPAAAVMGRMAGASAYHATVNIYVQRLDDRTINQAAEKIHRAVKQQQGRY